jgi:hypothetical protein
MPGEAAVIEAARALEEDVRQEGFHAVFPWVDDRQMVDRLLAAPSLPAEFEEEVRRDVRAEELFAFLYDDVGEFGSFDFLGTVRHGDHVRARFRAVNSNLGVTYHDFEFSHDPKRALRISDSRQMMADSDLVDYLGTFFELLESFDPDDDDARRVAEYLAAGSDIDEYASGDLPPFPADAITERNALILHLLQLKAAADLSVEALEIAIDALAERFPNHPSLPHRRLELAILQGDRQAALLHAAAADRLITDPLAAEITRARIHAEHDDMEAALMHIRRAVAIDPRNQPAVLFQLGAAVLTDDFAAIVETINHLEEHLGFEFVPEHMATNPHLEAFMESEEYAAWLATR